MTPYAPSQLKVTPLLLALCYAILAHTLTGRRESTGVIGTFNTYFVWNMATSHTFDLAYFIILSCHHQIECSRKGPIYSSPYLTPSC
ncbi:hypothetical protein J1N35_041532 [Gossypium stocksii]|uniref:Uncharacterized protein n=1 Tax=Gossypium stocksii TaxID=47602 RepID=A0A9D3UG44_9ROSI|nr:hypothetical protein J1N35_041532 [Gossypium stocksii]